MELLKVIAGWALIILIGVSPVLIPVIVIHLFFGGIISFVKGIIGGQIASIVAGIAFLALGVASVLAYRNWTGANQEIRVHSKIEFANNGPNGTITPAMLERPRNYHIHFASGPFATEVVEILMSQHKIDALVGDRRTLPLKREKTSPYPNYWDETFRLRLKSTECALQRIANGQSLDMCFEAEKLTKLPKEAHFGFSKRFSSKGQVQELFFWADGKATTLATCTAWADRPLLPSPANLFKRLNSPSEVRVGKMDPYTSKELDEMRKCQVKLLQQFAVML